MPRAEKQIHSRIKVTIMYATAVSASPHSLIQARTPFRAGDTSACGTGLRGKVFANFRERRAMLNSLVTQHGSEGRPANILNTLGHAGLAESFRVDVANGDKVEFLGEAIAQLVQSILAAVRDLSVNALGLALVVRPLCCGELRFKAGVVSRVGNLLACGQGSEVLEAKVDTDCGRDFTPGRFRHFNDKVQIPVAFGVLIKTGAVANLAGQFAGIENAECLIAEPEGITFALYGLGTQRHPAEGLPAAIPEPRPPCAGLCILLAGRANAGGAKPKLNACTASGLHQSKSGRPLFSPLDGMLLRVIAVIPNEVDDTRPLVQLAVEVFDSEAIRQVHSRILPHELLRRSITTAQKKFRASRYVYRV